MASIMEEVSTLTTIPTPTLNKLMDKFAYCMVNDFVTNLNQSPELNIDLGFGILTIVNNSDSISYKFKPSVKLERAMLAAAEKGENTLINALEDTLVQRIIHTYKDIM